MRTFLIGTALIALTPLAASPPAPGTPRTSRRITVEAGAWDRRETLVTFAMPAASQAGSYRLREDRGREIPLQVDPSGRAWFVLNELRAGTRKTFTIQVQSGASTLASVQVVRDGDSVRVSHEGRPVLRYQEGQGELPQEDVDPSFRRGGYIHPVFTPSGRVVTDDYPPDHRHHHGIWFAWTRTEFDGRKPDFWNMGQRTGTVEFETLEDTWSGPVHGGIRARHRYVDLTAASPTAVLREAWDAMVYAVGRSARRYALFDLNVAQECATSSPLVLPEYHYGGVGFRGSRQWNGEKNALFLTSEGKDRSNGHGTRARWCHIGGRVDGELAGMAILGHPENFRSPQPMRIHPQEPFFCYAPSQLGRWEIAPGTPYVSRYRFVVFDGAPDPKELDRLWNDYAEPPRVRVE